MRGIKLLVKVNKINKLISHKIIMYKNQMHLLHNLILHNKVKIGHHYIIEKEEVMKWDFIILIIIAVVINIEDVIMIMVKTIEDPLIEMEDRQ